MIMFYLKAKYDTNASFLVTLSPYHREGDQSFKTYLIFTGGKIRSDLY